MAVEQTYIVIPVHSRGQYDTRDCFTKCVETVEQHTTNFRLILVDDWCDDLGSRTIRDIATRISSAYVIATSKQRFFSRAVNLGLRLVRSPWCVVLNSDCVVDSGWLEELYAVRDEVNNQGKRVGLVGSELSGEEPRRYQEITYPSTPGNPGYCTGHCWLLSMQALYECSVSRGMPGFYLDETRAENIHIRSDNELCRVMNQLGWSTVRSFKAAVGHLGGRSWGHDLAKISRIRLEDVND